MKAHWNGRVYVARRCKKLIIDETTGGLRNRNQATTADEAMYLQLKYHGLPKQRVSCQRTLKRALPVGLN